MATAEPLPDSSAWNDQLLQNPHTVADKRRRVQKMFAAIAPSYDLNNRLHSLWMDQAWRRKAVKLAEVKATDRVVDVACGTGDLTLKFSNAIHTLARQENFDRRKDYKFSFPHKVIGIDFTYEMLPLASKKTPCHKWMSIDPPTGKSLGGFSHSFPISEAIYINGDAQSLPLPTASADILSIAFGIRNVADPAAAIREFRRVLKPGGRLIILEFSLPTNPILRGLYNFYFRKILPTTATLISGDKTGAYKYLPESVNTFIGREQMTQMMTAAGFQNVEQFPLTFGVCVCYRGRI